MKLFRLPMYFIRHKIPGYEGVIRALEKEDMAAIHVIQPYERDDWERFLKGDGLEIQLIQRWKKLCDELKQSDVIMVSHYNSNSNYKMGIVRKGSSWSNFPLDNDFKAFQMVNTQTITYDDYILLKKIIPSKCTISPVIKAKEQILSLYKLV